MMSISNSHIDSRLSSKDQLLRIWANRYLSSNLCDTVSSHALERSVSFLGRQRTVERLQGDLIEDSCQRAAIRTKDLYTHHQDLDLHETAELARLAMLIYPVLLEFYRTHEPAVVEVQLSLALRQKSRSKTFEIPDIQSLIDLIEPHLSIGKFQDIKDIRAANWQVRSFLTTEINLSSKLLLEFLSPPEQALLKPYFDLLEESVAIPWQQVCLAAADHPPTSNAFRLVKRMLPKLSEIALAVHTKNCQRFGGYYNRRGQLDSPGVRHSSLRDLEMFQVYLRLCLLQGNLDAIEQELFVLCDLVYRGIGVPWGMAIQASIDLVSEIMQHLEPNDQGLLEPYAHGLIQVFAAAS